MALLRFRDLKDRKIVSNHMTLKRWIEREGFPPGCMLGPNTRAWTEDEIGNWLSNRPVGKAALRGFAKNPQTYRKREGGAADANAA